MAIILLVDDEPTNLQTTQVALNVKHKEWRVETAESTAKACEQIKELSPDVIVTDLVMESDNSGIDVLSCARKHDALCLVIIVTAFEGRLDRYQAFRLGAFDCVARNTPGIVAIDEIETKVASALEFRKLAISEIKSRARIAALEEYLDPQVAAALRSNPDSLAPAAKTITICFWDIRGFSRLSQTLRADIKLLSGFLTDYFQLAAEVVNTSGGILDKYIGDGVMALFGALGDITDDHAAQQAVSAALQLRARFADVHQKWARDWSRAVAEKIEIGLGAGIHTGNVIVGQFSAGKRGQFTALGPDVNLAQRLEANAGVGEILISTPTQRRLHDKFTVTEGPTLDNIKNIDGKYPTFKVLNKQ